MDEVQYIHSRYSKTILLVAEIEAVNQLLKTLQLVIKFYLNLTKDLFFSTDLKDDLS